MSMLNQGTWIDRRTGARVPNPRRTATPHADAVLANSYVYATTRLRGLEGLRAGQTLVIDTTCDLQPFRLARGWDPNKEGIDYLYAYPEVRAAFDHPWVTREQVVEGVEAPDSGQRLALYDAIEWWLAFVEREWGEPAPGEPLVAPAVATIEPILLDLCHEHAVTLRVQCAEWVHGCISRIPASAADETERCLRAALDACRHLFSRALDDQLGALGARAGVQHWIPWWDPPVVPNALQCATYALEPCYRREPALWRPVVDLESSPERVALEMRSSDPRITPIGIDIDRARIELTIADKRETLPHDGDRDRLWAVGETVAERVRTEVRRVREDAPGREHEQLIALRREEFG